ncbi:hypothetical protein ABIC32_002417 [Brevundimonas sp. 1080]|uniref:hypothetical protein n=1 Tax=Brevundimonas sp. 1080 TaxID=3156405 RepID=UPI0033988B11
MHATFQNPLRKDYTKYIVDGCLLKNCLAADFAVEEVGVGMAVVELKGGRVEHALKQVSATTEHFRKDRDYREPICAVIVSRQSPLGAASIARHRLAFARAHGGAALHVHSSRRDFVIADLLKASGKR